MHGLNIGMPKSKVNAIINQIRLDRDEIAWMNIDLKRNKRSSQDFRNNRKTTNNKPKRIL